MAPNSKNDGGTNLTSTFHSADIECDGCANSIKSVLGRLSGVQAVEVDVDSKQISVTHEDVTSNSEITAALEKAGFPVS